MPWCTFSPEPKPARNTFREIVDEAAKKAAEVMEEWPEVRTMIVRTLRHFPDALTALRAALIDRDQFEFST